MSSVPQAKFYVYILARPDGTPFYVGKGTGNRVYAHETEARRGCLCHKCNVIRKIWRGGGELQRYTVFTTNNEREAFQVERETIAQFERKNLCNKSDGGEGPSGRFVSTAERKRRSQSYQNNPEARRKMAEGARRRMERLRHDEAYKAAIGAQSRERWADPEYHERVTAQQRAAWQNPEFRAQMITKRRELAQNSEYLAALSERTATDWQKPGYRENQTAKQRAAWTDPEVRAKRAAGIRANNERRRQAAAPPEMREDIRRRAAAGQTQRNIAKDLGIGRKLVRWVLTEADAT